MTRQPPDPETIRTERAFTIYIALLNSPNLDRFFPLDLEEDLSSLNKQSIASLAFELADSFITFKEGLKGDNF